MMLNLEIICISCFIGSADECVWLLTKEQDITHENIIKWLKKNAMWFVDMTKVSLETTTIHRYKWWARQNELSNIGIETLILKPDGNIKFVAGKRLFSCYPEFVYYRPGARLRIDGASLPECQLLMVGDALIPPMYLDDTSNGCSWRLGSKPVSDDITQSFLASKQCVIQFNVKGRWIQTKASSKLIWKAKAYNVKQNVEEYLPTGIQNQGIKDGVFYSLHRVRVDEVRLAIHKSRYKNSNVVNHSLRLGLNLK